VGAYEAKTHLSRLLDDVAKGDTVTITKHGLPVARLVPPEDVSPMSVRDAIEEIKELRKRNILGPGLTSRQLIEEGRKY
jgi:prevent-host-death family protein